MKFSKAIVSIPMLAALCLPLVGQAQEPTININSRNDQAQPVIIVRSKYDFGQNISLKMKTDPALSASDVLIKAISKYGMVDAHGIKITSGFDVDVANNLVVAFSGGTSEIIKTRRLPNGFQVIGSFKDQGGNFVSPPIGSLAVYSTGGENLCFEYKDVIKTPQKMVFVLLVDRSGSMAFVIEDVKKSTRDFLTALPSTAQCAVTSFDSEYRAHSQYYQSCNSGNFKLDNIAAQGGTDLYTPLLESYENLSQPFFKDYQKAVIIITDGNIVPDRTRQSKIQTAKKDTLTFAYLLGYSSDLLLKDIADGYLHDPKNVKIGLERYFKTLSTAYKTQKVLNVRSCQGSSYANP